jgi:hypothetical protein
MTKSTEKTAERKRERIQERFWEEVGAAEHISIPELENAIRKEFRFEEGREVQAQIRLMQTEGRIRVQTKVKVWIMPPSGFENC